MNNRDDNHRADRPPLHADDGPITQWFPGELASTAAARHFTIATLYEFGCAPSLRDDATLVVSELTTNAIVHAHSDFSVTVERTDGCVQLTVIDDSPLLPLRRWPAPDAEGGRGLYIVDCLAETWHVGELDHGKIIEVRLTCGQDCRHPAVRPSASLTDNLSGLPAASG